jgi:HK97 family phage major capsid protein
MADSDDFTDEEREQLAELQDSAPTLLGRPVSEVSNMDGTIGGGAGNDSVLVYGSFDQFVIVDHWPATLEVIRRPKVPDRSTRVPAAC